MLDSSKTDGSGLTGLVYSSAGLSCYYVRPGSAAAALALATQTVTGSHSDGGFVEIDATNMPGMYRLDLSDAILASGVESVAILLKGAANMAPVPIELQLIVRQGETQLRSGTAQAGGTGTITLDAGASAVTDYYKHGVCALVAGTGAGQSQIIDSYNGSTKVATMAASWATAPDNTTTFVILPLGTIPGASAPTAAAVADAVYDEPRGDHIASGSVGEALYRIHADIANKKTATSGGITKLHKDDQSTLLLTRTLQQGGASDEVDLVTS